MKIKEVYEALAKNGYRWGQGEFVERFEDGTIIYACAIGQAALNLDVAPSDLHLVLNSTVHDEEGFMHLLAGEIETYNDTLATSYAEVVEYAKKVLEPYFEVEIEL